MKIPGGPSNASVIDRIDDALVRMRRAGRRVVRIVDNKCGEGSLLIHAAERAAALGFVAVEALGFDRSANNIAAARTAAAGCRATGVRLIFAKRSAGRPIPIDGDTDLMLADTNEDPPGELERLTDPGGAIIEHGVPRPA